MILVRDIQRIVAIAHGLPVGIMTTESRERILARPRQEAMFLARKLIRRSISAGRQRHRISFPELGKRFGNRHHTTVMHACRAVEKRLALDADLRAHICRLSLEIAGVVQ